MQGDGLVAAGIVRLMAAFHDPLFRVPLAFSGVVSTILGLIVLLNLFDATYVLLGILLGVYSVVDGITVMAIGRWRVVQTPLPGTAEQARAATQPGRAEVEMPDQRKPAAEKQQEQRRRQPH